MAAMKTLLAATALSVLTSPLALAAPSVGTCQASVGVWEFTTKEGGRMVVAKDGQTYRTAWVTSFVAADGSASPEGVVADCSCQNAPSKLLWNCRVAYSHEPAQIGTELRFEWTVEGGALSSWYLAADGTRSPTGMRRPK